MASPATRLTKTTEASAAPAALTAAGMNDSGCQPRVRPQVPVSAVALV